MKVFGQLLLLLIALLTHDASAHMYLITPLSRGGNNVIGGTGSPCNGLVKGSGTVTTYTAGAKVQFQFHVNQHGPDPFQFRLTTGADTSFETSGEYTTIVSGIPNDVTTSAENGFQGVNVAVTIPNITCTQCSIQLSGMGNNGVNTWYNCADVKILAANEAFPLPTSATPDSGPLWGENQISIVGSQFGNTAPTLASNIICYFGKIQGTGTWISSTQLTCTVPPVNTPGMVTLEVSLDGGQTVSLSGLMYTYVGNAIIPTITSISPTFGPPGTTITVTGSGFYSSTLYCRFSTSQVSATVLSSTSATCVAPNLNSKNGLVSLEVSVDGQTYSDSGTAYTIGSAPASSAASSVVPSILVFLTLSFAFFFGVLIA